MIKIGITGQSGFIGKHLYNTIGLFPNKFERIEFNKSFFTNREALDHFISQCDVVVHLAAMNRHGNPQVIYDTNIDLVSELIGALNRTNSKAHVLFSSSTQEEKDNQYGKSKKVGREMLSEWASNSEGSFTGLIIPNVFGPFGNPYYNSVVATFCHQLSRGETPRIEIDGQLKIIYVSELIKEMLSAIQLVQNQKQLSQPLEAIQGTNPKLSNPLSFNEQNEPENPLVSSVYEVPYTYEIKVSEILSLLQRYKQQYLEQGIIPHMMNEFERNLFNTFRCYIDIKDHFPVKFKQHTDDRGAFVEIVKLSTGGQVSFSTTKPGITRGNHFHTRKIERFAVIKGEALIQLRQIGTNEVIDFHLDGNEPSYVDMPIWYTHNIKNIGDEELFTIFWINEFFDPVDADTYMEAV